MKIAILYGGRSGEHDVSLMSAASIVRHLDRGHSVRLIGVTKDGAWRLQPDRVLDACREGSGPLELKADAPQVLVVPGQGLMASGARGSANLAVDVVFPVLHGTFGEDGTVQGLLECAGLAYVGADVFGSALCMDKERAKALWASAGLPVVPYVTAYPSDLAAIDALADRIGRELSWPAFVKPARCGSSVGASKVASRAELKSALAAALEFDTKALVEPFVAAREIECSVLGNAEPRAFPPGELVPSHEFYDYEAKYIDPDGARLLVPAPLDEALAERVKSTAVAAYRAAGISGMARVDFFLDKASGRLLLNEANTIPGFTPISMYPMMCEEGGLPYAELIDELLRLAVERKAEREALRYER